MPGRILTVPCTAPPAWGTWRRMRQSSWQAPAHPARRFEKKVGMSCDKFFGDFSYTHERSGRQVEDNVFPFHSYAFDRGLIHAENVGGDIELMLNQRAIIGAFPWRYDGLE